MKRIRHSTRHTTLDLPTLKLEGSLFLPDQLEKAAQGRAQDQTEADFGVPKGVKLKDEYSRAFQIACAQWQHFAAQHNRADLNAHRLTESFVTELLRDALGYTPVQPAAAVSAQGLSYPVSLMAGPAGSVPVLIAPYDLGLDDADPRFAVAGSGNRKKSAFQAMQELLNASPDYTWGLISNGLQLRLLRDAASLTRPTYLEVDLADLLGGNRYAEFANVWRLLHGSRAPQKAGTNCVWERWREAGQVEGTRVREGLRNGVEQALLALGEGFLQHPANEALRTALHDGSLSKDAYFQQLLRLIYRLIFVFTVEERGVLHTPDDSEESIAARRAYAEGYALARLREVCLKRRARNRHDDHWQAIRIVFKGLADGEPRLALPALGGLFAPDQCQQLDAAGLSNTHLLAAIGHLRWARVTQGRASSLSPVDYRNMGPEELGSVYESLLELVPTIDLPARRFGFVGITEEGSTAGNARKTSGSYYTPDSLVQELIKSALDPVIEQRLAASPANPTEALLGIRVIDPACGSGHFLLAAARRLAEKLAQLRSLQGGQEGAVKPQDYRHALRDVVARCIYGVDRNPMAIELARTALWLESFEEGRPLGFLDHHLQVGDALLGVTDLKVLELGIAKDAFKPLSGDDKEVCKQLAKANAAALKDLAKKRGARAFGQMDVPSQSGSGLAELQALEALPEDSTAQISAKAAAYGAYLSQARSGRLAQAAHLLLGAYLLPKRVDTASHIPTTATLYLTLQGLPLPADQHGAMAAAQAACSEAHVFHWPLAFPQVLAQGGFDCVLGNPPWERIKLQEEEFFATRHRDVALAKNKAERAQRIQWLSEGRLAQQLFPQHEHPPHECEAEQRLHGEFISARRTAEAASLYAHVKAEDGGRYPLTGVGDVNTYALFAETIDQITHPDGRGGFIVPSGIGTDDSTKLFFQSLVEGKRLVSFFGFDNAKRIFPAVHSDTPFALVTIGSTKSAAELAHYLLSVDDIGDARRRFNLSSSEFQLINPNTLTCPVFRTCRDAELTKKLYAVTPVLINDKAPEGNPWRFDYMTKMFDIADNSKEFIEFGKISEIEIETRNLSPLREAKHIHLYDHRWATTRQSQSDADLATPDEKSNTSFTIRTRYWIPQIRVEERLASKGWTRPWLMGWRGITNATNERTAIAAIFPRTAISHSLRVAFVENEPQKVAAFIANISALILDYACRQKIGGTNLTVELLKQLPVLHPDRYTAVDIAFIVPRVLELTYTAHDMQAWAQDLGFEGAPFKFDPNRRAEIRGELDAYYARLYNLDEDELRYILDPADVMGADYPSETFRVLKNREMKEFGEYRTQRLVLREFRRMAIADANSQPYTSLLNPPPGVQALPSYSAHGVIQDDTDAHLAGLLLTLIEQGQRLPRRELNDVFVLAGQTDLHERLLDAQGLALLRSFMQSHTGIFDSTRVAGDRVQGWLRHFETRGVIRLISAGDLVERIVTVPLPAEVRVSTQTATVATLLAAATKQAFSATVPTTDTQAATPSMKQA